MNEIEHPPSVPYPSSPALRAEQALDVSTLHVEEPTLHDYLRVIAKRKFLIAVVALTIVLGIGLYSFLVTPIFVADTIILIERRPPRLIDVEQALVETLGSNEETYYETQYEILRSRSLAVQVIREERLGQNPLFAGPQEPSLRERVTEWLFGPPENDSSARVGGVAVGLIDHYIESALDVEPMRDSRLVKISFGSRDARLSSRVLNAHVQAYIGQGLRLRTHASEEARGFLKQSLTELKDTVEQSEQALNDYRRERGIVFLASGENIVLDRLTDLNQRLTETQAERITYEAQVRVIRGRDLDSLPAVIDSQLIAAIKEQYTTLEGEYAFLSTKFKPNYPHVVQLRAQLEGTRRRLREEIESVVAGIESVNMAALTKEEELRKKLEEQKTEALRMKDAAVEYAILEREADTNQQLYDSVLQRMKEMGVAAELRASNIFVIDAAYPPAKAAHPRKKRNLAIALVLGVLAGLGAAFAAEYFDNTLKTPQDVERYLGLASLGVVPDFLSLEPEVEAQAKAGEVQSEQKALEPVRPGEVEESRELAFARDPLSLATESYRSIRTGILLSQAGEPPQTILFSSGARGEGKTATTLNTAVLFAQLGAPVLLIDADLRRPSCHSVLGVENTVGLTEVLTGQVEPSQAIRLARPGLFFLSSGSKPPNPTELLGSRRMVEVLAGLQSEYAYVLIDAPPLIAVSDSVVLSTLVDGVVLVVDQQATPRQVVREARTRLARARARVIGVVLNRCDMRMANYGNYMSEYAA